jgi:hypothetical protein
MIKAEWFLLAAGEFIFRKRHLAYESKRCVDYRTWYQGPMSMILWSRKSNSSCVIRYLFLTYAEFDCTVILNSKKPGRGGIKLIVNWGSALLLVRASTSGHQSSGCSQPYPSLGSIFQPKRYFSVSAKQFHRDSFSFNPAYTHQGENPFTVQSISKRYLPRTSRQAAILCWLWWCPPHSIFAGNIRSYYCCHHFTLICHPDANGRIYVLQKFFFWFTVSKPYPSWASELIAS